MSETPRHAIILFSHGSLLCGAGENLRLLAEQMQIRGDADIVRAGYLNYSEPSFEETFQSCVEVGATRITIAPYFLVDGFFVKVQLPPKIAVMQEKFPEVEVRVAKAMCRHELLAEAVLSSARREHSPAQWRHILKTAPQFCRADEACPLFGGELCPASSGAEFRVPSAATMDAMHPTSNSQKSLLIMIHGSPRPISNDDIFAVIEEVKKRGEYSFVQPGFMECNDPDIPAAIEKCVQNGATHLVAMPYFLHTGKHVADDLPSLLEEAQGKYPDVSFSMCDYLGRDPLIADILRDRVNSAQPAA